MAELGFRLVDCGEDGPAAWAIAAECNARWDAVRHCRGNVPTMPFLPAVAPGSIAEAFARIRNTWTWREKKPRTREDWLRGWKHIAPSFGERAPAGVSFEEIDAWYGALLGDVGVREAHRAMKIWRALWHMMAGLRTATGALYCDRAADPSAGVRRRTPKPRNAIWLAKEALQLVNTALDLDYLGLAAALQVAWDTMLSPVDVRSLTLAQLRQDGAGSFFELARAKTGKAAIGTLSDRANELITALPYALHPDAPIFRTRAGAPYRADSLGKDFRAVRAAIFPGDSRTLMDFRRSGAVEATAGDVNPAALAGKMANSIDANRELQATYQPHNATLVRLADAARARGRDRLRFMESKRGVESGAEKPH
jgi:hypothetical protein